MSLRTRLIVAFFTLSVVPLGAVTFYAYASNAKALREAAEREADLLAGELGQRMQLVTAQLSERVEHLMEIAELQSAAERAAATQPSKPTPVVVNASMIGDSVAQALGETAMLLNNVEFRGLPPPGGGRQGRPPSGAGRQLGRPRPTLQGSTAPPGALSPPAPPPGAAPPPAPPAATGTRAGAPALLPGAPPVPSDPLSPRPPADLKDRIRIDMAPLRREIFRQMLPEGKQPDSLTSEERQRLGREVTQRMLGLAAGIQLGAAEVQKKAEEAGRQAAAAAKAAQAKSKATATEPTRSAQPMKKTSSLSGNRLDVKMEQDGQVVQQANAEINFANVLATVFSTTRRDRGEVPFAVGRDGQLYTRSDDDRRTVETLGAVTRPGGPLTARLNNWIVVTTEDPSGSGLRLGIARPVGDSLASLRRTAARNAGFGLLFIAIALAGIVPLSTRLTRNLSALGDGVRRIARGDYAARVPVRARDEVGELALAFNQMAEDVEKHQRAAVGQERIKRELELGRQIQHDMLPHAPLRLGLTEIKGVSVPAREVGGDFFNYFELPSGQIALLVGDVSGKGVGAALLMANIQASLRTRLALGQDLSALAREIDVDIEANSPGPVYATLFVGIMDPATRRLRYVNAGHHPQYILRANGGLDRMASTGLPVGLFAGHGFVEQEAQLSAGDLLFFYTDGCVEAESESGDMFGAERLEALLLSIPVDGTDDVLTRVEQTVNAFRGTREAFDDATMMAVKVG